MKTAIATTTYAVVTRSKVDIGTVISTHKSKAQALRSWHSTNKKRIVGTQCIQYTGTGLPLTTLTKGQTICYRRLDSYLSFGDMRCGTWSRID